MIVSYIEVYAPRFGVAPICRVLSQHGMPIAPSTYYARRACPVTNADLTDAYAANDLLDCFRVNRSVYGLRKLWHAMRRDGHDLGRDQISRLMRIVGITGALRGDHRTRHHHPGGGTRGPPPRPRGTPLEHPDPSGPVVGGRLLMPTSALQVLCRPSNYADVCLGVLDDLVFGAR